ncbi:MAG: SGNH/GDSL hydrolase family protein [Clostridia bacterium]|nr:SGNH/GDSL hydrolase family protein [Clostridia bacterium]
MKKVKIVFQGDSITDAGRDRRNYHHMGNGYPKYASELLVKAFPEVDFEFINFGISGNRTGQLFDRLYGDAIAFQPDIISVLIGINDVWHRYGGGNVATTDAQIALNYRCILERLKKETNAKIMILSPYLLDCQDKEPIREDLKTLLPIVRELAAEFADVYVPLDEKFEEALKTQPEPKFYSGDGVHPNANGAEFIGKLYAEAIKPLVESV